MLWFNFTLGVNFIFFCFKLIIIYTIPKNKGYQNLNQGSNCTTTYIKLRDVIFCRHRRMLLE